MDKVKVEYAPSFFISLIPAEPVGRCAVCGKELEGNDRVYAFDHNEKMVCEHCMVFEKLPLSEFLDLLGIDYYAGTAKEMTESG